MKFSVREGINIFLAGFVPTENMGLRDYELYYQEIISVKKNDQMYIIKIKYN
jgi:translation initiation factor RLI1